MVNWWKEKPGEDAVPPKKEGFLRWFFVSDTCYVDPTCDFIMKLVFILYILAIPCLIFYSLWK